MSAMFQARTPCALGVRADHEGADGAASVEHLAILRGTIMTRFSFKRTAAAGLLALAIVGGTLGVVSAQAATGTEFVAQQAPTASPVPKPERPARGERPQLTDEQRQQMQQQHEQAHQKYIDTLAKNLGVSSDTVKAAFEQTHKDMQAQRVTEIQQAVTDGKLTQEQADQMIQRMQAGPGGHGGPGGMRGPGMGGHGMGGPGGMRGPGGPGGTGR